MTQQLIYQMEQINLDRVYLYKEGLFWKAYERSAFHLYCHLRAFKPTKKMVKSVGDFVISVGFPITSIAHTLTHLARAPQYAHLKQLVLTNENSCLLCANAFQFKDSRIGVAV